MKKLWGGRFKKEMDPLVKCFSYSLLTDGELFDAELRVNRAWAKMLARQKLISQKESRELLTGLRRLDRDFRFRLDPHAQPDCWKPYAGRYEDVHSLIQGELEKRIGAVAKKLHTGRSRNDLVVTSTRIYLREKAGSTGECLAKLEKALLDLAEKAGDLPMAGLTHLRFAQPVLAAHHLLAYVEMLEEDKERLADAARRLDVLGLGSAALAGSSLALDQKFLARELGFSKIARNSMQAVSDRAFAAEWVACLAILWVHLSRLSEDFILWNSEPFHYIELDDAFATGSSLMPQKKNPDIFELVRGRSAVIFGHLQSLLTLQKGLPLAYNRDLQEDKPALFDSIRKTGIALELLAKTIQTVNFCPDSLALSVTEDSLFSTDLLEYWVQKGMPFAEAHHRIGQLIRHSLERKKTLRELPLSEWRRFLPGTGADVYRLFDAAASVRRKKTLGGTNPALVKSEIRRRRRNLYGI